MTATLPAADWTQRDAAITAALRDVYGMGRLADELQGR